LRLSKKKKKKNFLLRGLAKTLSLPRVPTFNCTILFLSAPLSFNFFFFYLFILLPFFFFIWMNRVLIFPFFYFTAYYVNILIFLFFYFIWILILKYFYLFKRFNIEWAESMFVISFWMNSEMVLKINDAIVALSLNFLSLSLVSGLVIPSVGSTSPWNSFNPSF